MKMKNVAAVVLAAVAAASIPLIASAEETYNGFNYTVNDDNTVTITGYDGENTELVIPDEIDGKVVTSIYNFAFKDCTSLMSIEIPDSVTSIGRDAFSGCASLAAVTIPNGITRIEMGTFSHTSLTEVIIPDSVTFIGANAFYGCTKLTSIEIPGSVTTIDQMVFKDCTSFTSIVIPEGVTNISNSVFWGCTNLESITLPASLTVVGEATFVECPKLKDVYYAGTEEQWKAIDSGYYGDDLTLDLLEAIATIHFESTGPDIADTEDPATPGDTDPADEQEILDVTLKSVDSEKGLEGAALAKALFGDSGWTWDEVEKIEFTSDDLFSVEYKAEDGWRALGDDAVLRSSDDVWNTAWTLNTDAMAKTDKDAKLIAKDGTIDITAKVYIKKGAEKPEDGANANTGIALAVAPVILAAGFVAVASKKRK